MPRASPTALVLVGSNRPIGAAVFRALRRRRTNLQTVSANADLGPVFWSSKRMCADAHTKPFGKVSNGQPPHACGGSTRILVGILGCVPHSVCGPKSHRSGGSQTLRPTDRIPCFLGISRSRLFFGFLFSLPWVYLGSLGSRRRPGTPSVCLATPPTRKCFPPLIVGEDPGVRVPALPSSNIAVRFPPISIKGERSGPKG